MAKKPKYREIIANNVEAGEQLIFEQIYIRVKNFMRYAQVENVVKKMAVDGYAESELINGRAHFRFLGLDKYRTINKEGE